MASIQTTFNDKIQIFLKGHNYLFGLLFLIIGSILSFVFLRQSDFTSLRYLNKELNETIAIVYEKNETNCSINDQDVMEYKYRFLAHDKTQLGTSYSEKSRIANNDTVRIEFVKNNLEVSRIIGMKNAPYSLLWSIFVIIFPVLGVYFVSLEIKKTNEYILILHDFVFALGSLRLKRKNSEDSDDTIYKVIYTYQNNQKEYTHSSYTNSPKNFKNVEGLIYSRANPQLSVLLKNLPNYLQDKILKIS